MGRILHLIPNLEEGGVQRRLSYVLSLAGQHEVHVAALIASPPDKRFPPFRHMAVPVHLLSATSDFYAPEILTNLRKLLREAIQFASAHPEVRAQWAAQARAKIREQYDIDIIVSRYAKLYSELIKSC